MFTLTSAHLRELCELNYFPVSKDQMVFLGLRGAAPVNPDDAKFRNKHEMIVSDIDYVHPRCSILQWMPADDKFAPFAASTVPHRRYVQKALARSGQGANQLMTGFYTDYRKGVHKAGSTTGHDAFRQTNAHPIRRTADDFDFDNDDRVEFVNPFDNIHAAWCMGLDHDSYASAGCQVIVGFPKCEKRGDSSDTGAWQGFKNNAYEIAQEAFDYVLLNGRDALRCAIRGPRNMVRLRYGSEGELVEAVQKPLKERGFYEGRIDQAFGPRMLRAVLGFQESEFGPSADDGIVGPMTAGALGVKWPSHLA